MRHRNALFVAAIFAAIAALVTPITVLAATYSVTVTGVEVYATATEGVFSGSANGALPGTWTAEIMHTSLATTTPTITGGTFYLATTQDDNNVLVIGTFVYGGSIVQTSGSSSCGNQTYLVTGALSNVGVYGQARAGSGKFGAVLTHYRYSFFGNCITYGASIAGTVSLDL